MYSVQNFIFNVKKMYVSDICPIEFSSQTFVQPIFAPDICPTAFSSQTFVQDADICPDAFSRRAFVQTHFHPRHLSARRHLSAMISVICPQEEIVWPARTLSGSRTFVRGRSYQFPCRRDPLFRNQGNHRESGDFPVDGSFAVSTVGREPELDLTTDTDTTSTERIIYAINNWPSDTFHKRLFTSTYVNWLILTNLPTGQRGCPCPRSGLLAGRH